MHHQQQIIKSLQNEFSRQQNLAASLESRLDTLPTGSLSCRNGYLYRTTYESGAPQQVIISDYLPNNDALIHQLKERQYIKKALPILQKNTKYLHQAVDNLKVYDPFALTKSLPACYQHFDYTDILLPGDIDPAAWAEQSYTGHPAFIQYLKYPSENGLLTRSKAESMIATQLEQQCLSFRYEPALRMGRYLFHPDFCVLHPTQRREIYWEHFGKMDDPKYACDSLHKLQIYGQHGYRLGENFIMTWETGGHPLTYPQISDCIKANFL